MEAIAKKDILSDLQMKHGLSREEADRALDGVMEVIKGQLLEGNQIVIKDFACMKIVEKKAQPLPTNSQRRKPPSKQNPTPVPLLVNRQSWKRGR